MRTLGQNPTDEEILAMMKDADKDGNLEIDFIEFCHLMAAKVKDNSEEELEQVFKLFDKHGKQEIDYRDLKDLFVELGTEVSKEDC